MGGESRLARWFWPEFRLGRLPVPFVGEDAREEGDIGMGMGDGNGGVPILGSAGDWRGGESVWFLGAGLMEVLG